MPVLSVISPAGLLATVRGLWWCDQNANVNSDSRLIQLVELQARVRQGFVGAIDAYRTGSRSATNFLAILILPRIKITNAGQRFAEVTDLVRTNAALPVQEILAILGQIVTVGGRHPDTGNHDARSLQFVFPGTVGNHGEG